MTDIYTKAKRSEIMSRVKSRGTEPEEKVAELLRQLKCKFRRNVKSLPGEPDFIVQPAKLAIFIHGCFWHGHTNCKRAKLPKTNKSFWKEKIDTNKKRDRKVIRELRKQRWHIMTVWQCRLRNPERVKKRLERILRCSNYGMSC